MKWLLITFLFAGLLGCGSGRQSLREFPVVQSEEWARFMPGDQVDLQVFQQPTLTGTFTIRPDGFLGVPGLRDIRLAGLTRSEADILVKTEVRSRYPEATVSLTVNRLITRQFSVIGEVVKPGSYPLLGNMTVPEALGASGGFTRFADEESIRLIRQTDSGSVTYEWSWNDLTSTGQAPTIRPQDVVMVDRSPLASVTGILSDFQPVLQSIIIILALSGNAN